MPMLMTLRMRLPVWPFHSPLRTRSQKAAILSSTAWTSGTTSLPSTLIDFALGGAQSHVQHRALLRDVDLLAAEHGVDALPQAGLLRQLQQQFQRLVGDAVLGIIEKKADSLGGKTLASLRVVGEQLAEMDFTDLLVVSSQRLPCGTTRESFQPACHHLAPVGFA